MLGVLACPECEARINVDLVREFTQVRCSCGYMLERGRDLTPESVTVDNEHDRRMHRR